MKMVEMSVTLDRATISGGASDLAGLSQTLRVLVDPNRLRILRLLTRQEMCVCDVMDQLGLGQSLVSHHLSVLKRIGLVQDRREAQWVYYSVVPEKLDELRQALAFLLDARSLPPMAQYGAGIRCVPIPDDRGVA